MIVTNYDISEWRDVCVNITKLLSLDKQVIK